jgi:hypothetical protein
VLVDDCCTCAAASVDDVPVCDIEECEQTECSAQNVPGIGVQCRFGSCEFEPVECNQIFATCGDAPPDCGDGLLPSVVDVCTDPYECNFDGIKADLSCVCPICD